mgnify:CR=1 FL=1
MADTELQPTLRETLARLDERDEPVTVRAVLEELGIELPTEAGEPRPADGPQLPAGSVLGRFALRREIGRGGMGRVLEAHDPQLRRSVAIKAVLHPDALGHARLARFVTEAQITAQLEHPNIVPVHEIGVDPSGEVFFVMKRVEGQSLAEVVRAVAAGDESVARTWTDQRLLHAFIQVCNAVAYAHDRGVLHRDLKPDNIMLGRFGEVLVMDWGVASVKGTAADGGTVGTPGFMSPEQARAELSTLDERSDVYSLGCILFGLLTWRAAIPGDNVYALLYATVVEPTPDPRAQNPQRHVPDEIAEVCMQAMAAEPGDRFANAVDLAEAVESFLEGRRRREQASAQLAHATQAWAEWQVLERERAALIGRIAQLEGSLDPWASLDRKAELIAAQDRVRTLGRERARVFVDVVSQAEQALRLDPDGAEPRAFLADVHWRRFEEAEEIGDLEEQTNRRERVRVYDDGRYAVRLRGTGSLTLHTDPAGAEVICARYERQGVIWPLVEEQVLGRTPLVDLPMEMGSYRLTIRAPGKRDTTYPVNITRGRRWDSGPEPVALLTEAQIGESFVYVPGGRFVFSGDAQANNALPRRDIWADSFLVAVFPVTCDAYAEFLNDLHGTDPEQAWSRVPRQESGVRSASGQYWEQPGPGQRYQVPEQDRDGSRWDPKWPITAVSWNDATAYAAWRSARDGVAWALPTEIEWEKAARGVDGRLFPWGERFDPTLCRMRSSQPGRPQPTRIGAAPTDVSIYGMRDSAGGVRDWCGDPTFRGLPDRRPIKGGSWFSESLGCRTAFAGDVAPWFVYTDQGFRLARRLTPDDPDPDPDG